ncbi:HU family DNA-binding protein [Isoptericola croceus]|uniref:HU family DNA-binding protein n=1 Tax=Isoptericola croceus TaxID=3031406 RepID=UPI0027BAF8C3
MEQVVSLSRSELVAALAERTGLSRSAVDRWLSALQEVLMEALARGETVTATGLFKVERVDRPGRTGRNPRTGGEVRIPAGFGVKISASQVLRRSVAGVVAPSPAPTSSVPRARPWDGRQALISSGERRGHMRIWQQDQSTGLEVLLCRCGWSDESRELLDGDLAERAWIEHVARAGQGRRGSPEVGGGLPTLGKRR